MTSLAYGLRCPECGPGVVGVCVDREDRNRNRGRKSSLCSADLSPTFSLPRVESVSLAGADPNVLTITFYRLNLVR